ncbi:MAG: PHP domain-containing protein [Bryobacteraceae bacterium]
MPFATCLANELISHLNETPGLETVTAAGSLRRGRETVGDLDLLASCSNGAAVLDQFLRFPRVHEVLGRGENKASALVGVEKIQVDVRALPRESYGALQYFSGSKEHNVALRQRPSGSVHLERVWPLPSGWSERVAGETEEGIYSTLGLAWIPPEMREYAGELELAETDSLPLLVEARQIRGDLHMHTRETDGRATLEEMAAECGQLGYEYIAITDHSKALAMANGLDETRAVAFAQEVREHNRAGMPLRVFSGLECDILREGEMDLTTDALSELEIVIGSVHSYMNLEPAEMTDRLMKALQCPALKVLGHLTGRLLLHREGYKFDFDL